MLRYIEQFQDLDEKREGLDFEINDLLHEIDPINILEGKDGQRIEDGQEPMSLDQIPPDSKVDILVKKMIAR